MLKETEFSVQEQVRHDSWQMPRTIVANVAIVLYSWLGISCQLARLVVQALANAV